MTVATSLGLSQETCRAHFSMLISIFTRSRMKAVQSFRRFTVRMSRVPISLGPQTPVLTSPRALTSTQWKPGVPSTLCSSLVLCPTNAHCHAPLATNSVPSAQRQSSSLYGGLDSLRALKWTPSGIASLSLQITKKCHFTYFPLLRNVFKQGG